MHSHQNQNLLISGLLFSSLISLLWVSSHSDGFVFAIAAVAFSFLGLTNYAMMHEAMHKNLHSKKGINHTVGMIISWMFPVSFTFMEAAHEVHHKYNRTDHEMFDYYYETDNFFVKYSQWYSILTGIYPPIIPAGSVLMAVMPGLFMTAPWQKAKSSSIIFNPDLFTKSVITKIRIDVALGVVFWVSLFYLLKLDPLSVFIVYVITWFNWSTRQYVTHAFTPRDIINGAHNLKVSPIMGWIFLNSHWDLVHHQFPDLAWQSLPERGASSKAPIPYWKQYFKLWLGPRRNIEPAPVIKSENYIHE